MMASRYILQIFTSFPTKLFRKRVQNLFNFLALNNFVNFSNDKKHFGRCKVDFSAHPPTKFQLLLSTQSGYI